MAVPLLWHKWLVHDIVGEEIWTREDTLIFSIILMIAFVIYVLWDSQKRHNKLKLLFLIPIGLSIFMFPPFVTMMTERIFMVYRMALILSCFVVMTVYIVAMRRRQTAEIASQRAAEEAAKAERRAKQQANNRQQNKSQQKKK